MSKSIMIQAQNKINLVGKLLDLVPGSGKLSDGRPYERATATIRVTQTFGGHEETSEVPVSFFATEYTSTGKPNPAWRAIQDLKALKTVQNVGIDAASTVRLSGASLRENNFVSRNSGQLINGWQINASFVNDGSKAKETASFVMDIFIMDMFDEVDREGDTTGRLCIKAGIVQYNGRLDIVNFVVENPDTADYIRRNWETEKTVTAKGYIRVTSIETKPSGESSGWGEDVPEGPSTQYVRELIITTGDDEPKEDEFAYDPGEIKKAFNVRKAEIEQMQVDAKKFASKASAPVQTESGASKYSWEG